VDRADPAHLRGHPVGERGPAGQPHLAAEDDEATLTAAAPVATRAASWSSRALPRWSPAWEAATAACTAAAAVGAGKP
jgi:hypothetical protein